MERAAAERSDPELGIEPVDIDLDSAAHKLRILTQRH